MDKGPNGTIEKFPARKNNDFMIKVLNHFKVKVSACIVQQSIYKYIYSVGITELQSIPIKMRLGAGRTCSMPNLDPSVMSAVGMPAVEEV